MAPIGSLAAAGVTAGPAAAVPIDSDTLVFVPFRGQTNGVWRNGDLDYVPHVTAGDAFAGDFSGARVPTSSCTRGAPTPTASCT